MDLGTLYVKLNADAQQFLKGMASAAQSVERFAEQTKRVTNEAAAAVGAMVAIGGAATALAATADRSTSKAMERLKDSTVLLAVQVSDVLMPAVRALGDMFRAAANWVAGLDEKTKANIASAAVFAVKLAVVLKVTSELMGVMHGAATAMKMLATIFGEITAGGLLTVLGVVVAIGVAIVLLHRAWRTNWEGIRDKTAEVFNDLGKAAGWLGDIFTTMWNQQIDGVQAFVNAVLDAIEYLQKLAKVKPENGMNVDAMRAGFDGLFKDLRTGDFFKGALTFAQKTASDLAGTIGDEVGIIKKEVQDALGLNSKGGSARSPSSWGYDKNAYQNDSDRKMYELGIRARATTSSATGMSDLNPGVISAGGAWLKAMEDEAKRVADASYANANKLAAAREKEMKARFDTAKAAQDAIKMAKAGITGNLAGLTAEQQQQVTADTGGDWSKLNEAQQNIVNWSERMSGTVQQGLTGALGEIGTIVNDAIAGAKAGGIWGAIIAVFMDILKRVASAKHFINAAMDFLKLIADALEPVVKVVFGALRDLLGALGEILPPIFKALKFIFDIVAFVVKAIATVILGILVVLNAIAGALGDRAAADEAKRLSKLVDDMWNGNAEAQRNAADAANDNAEAQAAAAEAASKVSQALTNVPDGYKVALAQYNAANAGTDAAGAIPKAGGDVIINGDVNISSTEPADEILSEMQRRAQRAQEQRSGTRGGGSKPANHAGDTGSSNNRGSTGRNNHDEGGN